MEGRGLRETSMGRFWLQNRFVSLPLCKLSSTESKLDNTLKEPNLIKEENVHLSNVLSEKNNIIHDLLLSTKRENSLRSQVQSVDNQNNVIYSLDGSDFGPKEIRLIGDSLIKHVIPERLIRDSDVKVIKHDAYHLDEIKSLIDSEDSGFKNVDVSVIHCGTNDIKEQTADTCLEKMKAIVDSLQTVNPKMKIILSNIAPRGDNEIYDILKGEIGSKGF